MITIRQLAACRGLGPPFSVRALSGGAPTSALALLATIMRPTIDLACVRVGDDPSFEYAMSWIMAALRDKLAEFDLAVGNVQTLLLLDDEAKEYAYIDSGDEAEALADEWELSGKHIDVFFVDAYAGAVVGSTPRRCGSCKDGGQASGIVIEIYADALSLVLAHEIGHYLCLEQTTQDPAHPGHHPHPDNLMYYQVPNGAQLTPDQIHTMKKHCLVYWACRPEQR